MNQNIYVPACHKFIHKKDGTPDYQRIYGVTKSAYYTKYPDKELIGLELLEFLQLNHIIPADMKTDNINLDHQELCFSIISQYKCNSICQLCPYSPLYKNTFENEEAFVLGYALNDWEHLQTMKASGITCRHFRAMIPVSEQSSVLVVPLNRLAFEYLETIPQSQNDLLSIADKIIATLKQNNKNKLSAADIKIAHKYLLNLSDRSYQNLNPEKIDDIMQKCFQLSLKQGICQQNITTDSQKQPDNSEKNDTKKPVARNTAPAETPATTATSCLEGFLSGKKSAPSVKKPISGPGLSAMSYNNNGNQKQTPSKRPVKTEKNETFTSKPTTASQNEEIKTKHPKQTIPKSTISTYTKPAAKEADIPQKENLLERKPQLWTVTADELSNFHVIDLDKADYLQIEVFLWNLLQTPLLPAEIVTLDKNMLFMVYARQKFYSFSVSNSIILEKILPYINRSKFRKLICYEPYMLYNFFGHQDIHSIQLFSLRIAADYTEPQHDWSSSAGNLIQKIACVESVSETLDAMVHHYSMYCTLNKKLQKLSDDMRFQYQDKMRFCRIIGKSFLLEKYCTSSGYLIKKETIFGYEFTFTGHEKMKSPYAAISYRFTWEEKRPFPILKLLDALSSHSILEQHMISLLSIHENELIFAVTPMEYSYLCDLINRLSSFYVKNENTSPITIDETILDGRLI